MLSKKRVLIALSLSFVVIVTIGLLFTQRAIAANASRGNNTPGQADANNGNDGTITRDINFTGVFGAGHTVSDVNIEIDFRKTGNNNCNNNTNGSRNNSIAFTLTNTTPATDIAVNLVTANTYAGDAANRVTVTFDDAAANRVGLTNGGALANGTFRPVAALSGFNGSDPNGIWRLSIIDTNNDSRSLCFFDATLFITTTGTNAPVADNDGPYTTNEDTTRDVNAATGVLNGDTDADGDTLTAVVDTNPAHGTLTLNADGSFRYVPAANYHGADSFTYHATDGRFNSNVATVTLNVTSVVDPPTGVNDTYGLPRGGTLTIAAPGVLANDSAPDSPSITAVLARTGGGRTWCGTGGNPSQPTQDNLFTFNADGSFTYRHQGGGNGDDQFSYCVYDGTAYSNVVTVTIDLHTANNAPTADNDGPYEATANTALTVPAASGVLVGDADSNGDAITASRTGAVTGPSHGSVVLSSNGSFTYTPTAGYSGSDSFTYRAFDGLLYSGYATVSINVVATNAAPVADNDAYTATEDTPLAVDAASGVLNGDTDADGDPLTAVLDAYPAHGTLTLSSNGSFSYTPVLNYNGPDSFTYHARDGVANSAIATVTITVNAVNDAPTAANDGPYAATEDTLLTVPVASSVLSNDSDPVEHSALTAVLVTNATNGVVALGADGSFTYTPTTLNFYGNDSFTYQARDADGALSNAATVTIVIAAVNDGPIADHDGYSVDEDGTLTEPAPGVLDGDADPEGDAFTAVLVAGPANGTLTLNANGSFSYTSTAQWNGTDSFTYQGRDASGALGNVATVTITVNPINDLPVAVNDGPYAATEDTLLTVDAASGVLVNDSDPVEHSPLTAALVSGPSHGGVTLNANGSFSYMPAADYNGPDSFSYQAYDGGTYSNTATVSLTVGGVNDAPTAAADAYTVDEDATLTVGVPGVLGNDSDPLEGGALTAALDGGPVHGSLTLNTDGSFTYTPDHNWNGSDSFTYHAVDDGNASSNIVTVTLAVNPMAEIPVTGDDTYSTDESTLLTVPAPGVLGNDTIEEGALLTAVLVDTTINGTLNLNSDGSFDYKPTNGYFGLDTFTYYATDGVTPGNTATVTIQVAMVNRAGQYGASDLLITGRDTPVSVAASALLANDFDPDGDPLHIESHSQGKHGKVTFDNGRVTYTPDPGFTGEDSFTYTFADNFGGKSTVTVTVIVWKPVPYCSDIAGEPNSQVYAVLTNTAVPTSANVFCRMLVENGKFLEPLSGAKIGDPAVLSLNIIQALDVFGMHYSGWSIVSLNEPVSICMRGQGNVLYMNVEGQPRTPTWVESWEDGQGFTCATIPNAGTVILVGQ